MMGDVVKTIVAAIVAVAAAAGALVWAVGLMERVQCESYAQATGRPTTYSALQCYVKDGDQWFTLAEFQAMLIASKRGSVN